MTTTPPGTGLDAIECPREPCGPFLASLSACAEAVRTHGASDLLSAWHDCQRADWMLWLCGMMADTPGWPTRQQVVWAACACAETALPYVKAGEEQPHQTIATARRWCRGEATIEEVRAAAAGDATADAVYAVYAASAAYAAYANAAANAVAAAADAACAAAATYATAAAGATCAATYVHAKALAELADLLRRPETWRIGGTMKPIAFEQADKVGA